MGLFNGFKALAGFKKKKEGTKTKPKPVTIVKKVKVHKTKPAPVKIKIQKTTFPKKIKKQKFKKVKKIQKKAKKTISKKPVIVPPKKITKANALKMLNREDAKEFIISISGQEGLKVLEYLIKTVNEIDEFTLADRVNLQINFVRSLLYKLYEQKLVSFSRERDKKKGWFIYSWIAHPERLKEILLRQKDEDIAKLKREALESQQVFYCSACNKSYTYVEAMENMFFCSGCGSQLEGLDSSKIREKVNHKIVDILKEKKMIEEI